MIKLSMPSLKHALFQSRYFFASCVLFVALAFAPSLIFNKADIFLALTPWHHSIANYFFRGVTQLGNGWCAVAIAILLIAGKQYKAAVLLILSYALSGVAAQIIKHLFMEVRPYLYFKSQGIVLPVVKDETVRGHTSAFPSGHTATIFSLVTALAMMYKTLQRNWGWLLLIALLVGYSRMYLSDHFLIDIAAGALLGVLATVLAYWMMYRVQETSR